MPLVCQYLSPYHSIMSNESLLPILWEDKVNNPSLLAYFQQFGVTEYFSAQEINQLRDAINELFFNGGGSTGDGNIKPTSIPIQYTGNATLQNLAAAINTKASFTVLPGQLPIFYAYSTLDKPTFRVLFKGLGAGIYGAGSFAPGEEVVKASTLQFISQTQASFQELEAMEGTQTINLGEIGSANPWTVLNAKNPKIFIQNYAVGNRLIKTLVSGVSVNYLFLGLGGDYGVGGLQSVAADFSIQSAEIVPIDISGKEDKTNKTSEITGISTTKYPNEKAVVEYVATKIQKKPIHVFYKLPTPLTGTTAVTIIHTFPLPKIYQEGRRIRISGRLIGTGVGGKNLSISTNALSFRNIVHSINGSNTYLPFVRNMVFFDNQYIYPNTSGSYYNDESMPIPNQSFSAADFQASSTVSVEASLSNTADSILAIDILFEFFD